MDEDIDRTSHRQPLIRLLLIASVAIIAFLTYVGVLGYFFTGYDSLTLIETSRIQSFQDVAGIFTHQLMAGTGFAKSLSYYRPVSTLSFSLDYCLWKLNPAGYFLTNLILHLLVSTLVFEAMRSLTQGANFTAWLSAVIFTTHPILVESVPVIARRQDGIAALFLMLSLLLFFNGRRTLANRKLLSSFLSVFAYALALGAKEIAIIAPFIICAHQLVFPSTGEAGTFRRKAWRALTTCVPYFTVTLIYLAWRFHVLGNVGGTRHAGAAQAPSIALSYFGDLLYPVQLFGISKETVLFSLFLALAISAIVRLLRGKQIQKNQVTQAVNSNHKKIIAFLSVWLLSPLVLCLATHTFNHHSMYTAIIPFSAILSIAFVDGLRTARRRVAKFAGVSRRNWVSIANFIPADAATLTIACLLCYSPLVRTYGEWEESGKISAMILQQLSKATALLPRNSVLRIFDLPKGIDSYKDITPHAQSVRYLQDYSIKSWLNLTDPENRLEVVVVSRSMLAVKPRDIELHIVPELDNTVIIRVEPVY